MFQATSREEFSEPASRRSDQLRKSSLGRHSPQFTSLPSHSATSRESMCLLLHMCNLFVAAAYEVGYFDSAVSSQKAAGGEVRRSYVITASTLCVKLPVVYSLTNNV